MSQNIECTECHDILAVEGGRLIEVPFVCPKCQDEEDVYELTGDVSGPFQYDVPTNVVEVATSLLEPAPSEAEKTSAMIADMQQQIAERNVENHDLRKKLSAEQAVTRDLADRIVFFNARVAELTKDLSRAEGDLKNVLAIAARLS